jgi:hypothetical protein
MSRALRQILVWAVVVAFVTQAVWLAVLGDWSELGFVGFAVVGALILTDRPENGVGRFLFGMTIFAGLTIWIVVPELALAAPAWLESIVGAAGFAFWAVFWTIGFIFPTGRPQTRLGRTLVGVLIAYGSVSALLALVATPPLPSGRPNPFAWPAIAEISSVTEWLSYAVLAPVAVGMVVDLVVRWRRAGSIERLQYRWFVFGVIAMIAVVLGTVGIVALLGATDDPAATGIGNVVGSLSLNLAPIAIGIAITRHGLYDIGRVVSRTVSYAIVTLLVVGIYAGLITALTVLLPSLPSVGVALATLAAAAIFLPVLRRVQRAIDRAFDRERYNAARVVEEFGERLRTGADPSAAADELVAAAERSLQPTAVGLWTTERRS